MGSILITGANGFIGKHLLKYISTVHPNQLSDIVLLTSTPVKGFASVLHNGYSFSKNEFSASGIGEIEVVIHGGAFTPKSSSTANDYENNLKNISNTKHLLDNLPNLPRKFIFLSTLDVYQQTGEVVDESTITFPTTFYGQCKLFCEQMILQWAFKNQCIPQILRVGHIYGPGEEAYKKLIPEAIRSVTANKRPVIYSHGTEKRSYLHVRDCVKAIWKATELKAYEGPINIVSSKPFSVLDIVNKIIAASGKNLEAEVLKKDIPVWDIIFNNQKMIRYLIEETVPLMQGLEEEMECFESEKP